MSDETTSDLADDDLLAARHECIILRDQVMGLTAQLASSHADTDYLNAETRYWRDQATKSAEAVTLLRGQIETLHSQLRQLNDVKGGNKSEKSGLPGALARLRGLKATD